MWKLVVIIWWVAGMAATTGYSEDYEDIGPYGMRNYEWRENAETKHPSANETAMNEIQELLSEYAFKEDALSQKSDCSDTTEIIWYIMTTNGYEFKIVGNGGTYKKEKIEGHMFGWVITNDGVIVVEPTWNRNKRDRLGLVLKNINETSDRLYLQGWAFDSPTEFLEVTGLTHDMSGITLDTPIEELPIRRKVTC